MASQILELTKKAKKGEGEDLARQMLYSGKAFEKFNQIIKAQGGNGKELKPGKFKKDILAKKGGKVREVHNKKINFLARAAGCPLDKFSGLYLYVHLNDKVKKGEKILTIYSESKPRLNGAINEYKKIKPIKIK